MPLHEKRSAFEPHSLYPLDGQNRHSIKNPEYGPRSRLLHRKTLFGLEYLQSAISNLLKSRRMLFERFSKNPLVMANSVSTSSTDRIFIQKLQEYCSQELQQSRVQHLRFSQDDVYEPCQFLSQSQRHVRYQSQDYIQLERLKTAAQILQKKEYQINEVCYMVGFSSPSYFTKCFQKQYGLRPNNL